MSDTPDRGTASSTEVVEFYPEGLLHKFGFSDGDMMYDVVEEHELGVDHKDLLIAVVERLLLPRLEQEVEVYTLVSLHNPIRAQTIDGEDARYAAGVSPGIVAIPLADIIEVARTLPPEDEDEW